MRECERCGLTRLLECTQLSSKMGALQSQLRSRKAQRKERKQLKQQQQASHAHAASSEKGSQGANETLSPPTNKRKINTFFKHLSPRPKSRNENSRENDVKANEMDQTNMTSDNNHLSDKAYLQSDSQADSAINLDNQSDSAIQLVDRENSDNFQEPESSAVLEPGVEVEKEEAEGGGGSEVGDVSPAEPVPVIISENEPTENGTVTGNGEVGKDTTTTDIDTRTQYLAVEGQSDTGISDISGGQSPLSDGNDVARLLLLPPHTIARRGSASSTTSTSSDEELPMRSLVAAMRGNKSRSWGLIKQVVHWSPFVQVYKKKYPWVQLAGHNGAFKPCDNGTILKKLTDKEFICLDKILDDSHMVQITPKFHGKVEKEGIEYVKMQDLLAEFDNPSVCDIKMGTRTYLEEELIKAREKLTMRKDMYEKMVKVDKNEPTDEEHSFKAVTKPRYMQWRERLSSTATLGFRIDGIKQADRDPDKNFKTVRTEQEVAYVLRKHIDYREETRLKLLERLKEIRGILAGSKFFHCHEVIGSSLLLVHDSPTEGVPRANIWMIDFGKTTPLIEGKRLDHRTPWSEGNQEDGYLVGLDNLVNLFENLQTIPPPEGLEDDQLQAVG